MSTERELPLAQGGQLPIQIPDLAFASLSLNAAVSILGKAYGCGQCSGKYEPFL